MVEQQPHTARASSRSPEAVRARLSAAAARAWYASPAYQKVLPLRTRNSEGDVILIDGVGSDHRATDILSR